MAYKPLIIDFETFYDTGYTLRTLPTIPYIMDDRFVVHGMAVFDLETGLNDWIGADDVRPFLKDASYTKRAVVAHNAPFDLGIVRYRYGMLPGAAVCTMQMAFRVIGNHLGNFDLDTVADYLRVGRKIKGVLGSTKGKHWGDLTPDEQAKMTEYAIQDVSLCYRIFAVMKPQMTRDAFEDLDWHIRVGLDAPFAADMDLLTQAIDEEEQRIAGMVAELGVEMRTVRSAAKFADLLRSFGVEPPMKWSAKQRRNIPAVSKTDREFRRIQMEHPDERVRKLCTLRLELASNSARTKLMRMRELARVTDGEMPVLINYCGALQTGRPSAHCIAHGTLVVTDRGLVPIEEVAADDLLWDGEAWVSHGGYVFNGVRRVVQRFGFYCTGDHLILTTEGWKKADDCTTETRRAKVRAPYGFDESRERRGRKDSVDLPMRLRQSVDSEGALFESAARARKVDDFVAIMRLPKPSESVYAGRSPYNQARYDEAPSLLCLEGDTFEVPQSERCGVPPLWRARDQSLSALDGQRSLFSGHADRLETRLVDRPNRQRRRLLPGELSLGYASAASCEQKHQQAVTYRQDFIRRSAGSQSGQKYAPSSAESRCFFGRSCAEAQQEAADICGRGESVHFGQRKRDQLQYFIGAVSPRRAGRTLVPKTEVPGGKKKVADLINAGPRNRFTVWTPGSGYTIVHNSRVNQLNMARKSTVRKAVIAKPGEVLVGADLSGAELRACRWLVGDTYTQDVIARGGDLYVEFYADTFGTELSDVDDEQRFVGKVCVDLDAYVLTDRGPVRLRYLPDDALVWDGVEFVRHDGVISNGVRPVIDLCGVWMTPDHKVLKHDGTWGEAQYVTPEDITYRHRPSCLSSVVFDEETVLRQQPSVVSPIRREGDHGVPSVDEQPELHRGHAAFLEAGSDAGQNRQRQGVETCTSSAGVGSAGRENGTATVRGVGSACADDQGPLPERPAGRRVDSSKIQNTEVGDILNCGPRNRFAVLCDGGYLIAHNCELSAQYQTGAEKIRNTIWAWSGMTVELETAQRLIEKFRYETHKPVADYWSYLQKTVIPTLAHASDDLNIPLRGLPAVRITKRGLVMPDGFIIKYPYLRQENNDESGYTEWVFDKKGGKLKGRIYGGAMLENLSQALVNVIISEKMRRLRRMGWRVGLSVYDEIVLTAPKRRADEAAEVLQQVMVERVEWWPDLPLEADVHVGHTYHDIK